MLKELIRRVTTRNCVHGVKLDEPCQTCDDWWVGGEESPAELPAGWVFADSAPRAIL